MGFSTVFVMARGQGTGKTHEALETMSPNLLRSRDRLPIILISTNQSSLQCVALS